MLNRNFYAGRAANTLKPPYPVAISYRDYVGNYSVVGSSYGFHGSIIPTAVISNNSSNQGVYLAFGSSDAEETFEDYTVKFVNLKGSLSTAVQAVYDEDTNTLTQTQRYVITNATTSDIAVSEFGIFATLYSYYPPMIYRKVFDEPFTIAANETVNFDLTVIYEMPVEFTPYVPV